MAHLGTVWKTEYVAEGAKISQKQFEELVELAGRIVLLARRLAGAEEKKAP